jgi:CRP/FNR family cyclic AMP-dependent transcriptional regulator
MDARSLAGPVVDVRVRAGTELVREGDVIGTFFVIRSGSAELTRGERVIETLGRGECFGEIDPIDSSAQPFGVTACSPLRLLAFSSFGISRLCEAIPGARERILDSLPDQPVLAPALAGSLPQRRRVKHGDRAVIRRDPAKLAHQSQRP